MKPNLLLLYLIFASLYGSLVWALYDDKQSSISIDVLEEYKNGSVKIITEEFTWHVAILRKSEEAVIFLCSGTAVSGEFVITAANCAVPIPTNELRVLVSLADLSRLYFQSYNKEEQICKVSKKYYHYHPVFNPGGLVLEDDITMLKLQDCNIQESAQLTNLHSTDRFSKYCFVLGWSGQLKMDLLQNSCKKPRFSDVFSVSVSNIVDKDNEHSFNKILNIRNVLDFSNMFILKMSQMLSLQSLFHPDFYQSSVSQEGTCQVDELNRIRVDLSAKHHYKCPSSDSSQICLYSRHSEHISKQVDIGSPVFCKIKREKKHQQDSGAILSQYVLVGIITNKSLNHIPFHGHNSSASIIKAANPRNFSKLLSALVNNVE